MNDRMGSPLCFPELLIKKVKGIIRLFETGRLESNYDLLVVLPDGAGITFGVEQTTENSGGLYRLLQVYCNLGGKFADLFEPYMRLLYGSPKGKKWALTNNDEFKGLLTRAVHYDSIMIAAQDLYFEKEYMLPASIISGQYALTMPLSFAVIYDSCIHSGVGDYLSEEPPKKGTPWHLWRFEDKLDAECEEHEEMASIGSCEVLAGDDSELPDFKWDDDEEEKAFISGYVQYRLNWLKNHNREAIRATAYRMFAFLRMIEADNWDLESPVEVHMARNGGFLKNPPLITDGSVAGIQVVLDELMCSDDDYGVA